MMNGEKSNPPGIFAHDSFPRERLSAQELADFRAKFQAVREEERRFDWNNVLLFYPTSCDPVDYLNWDMVRRYRMRTAGLVRDESAFGRTIPGWPPADMPRRPSDHSSFYPETMVRPPAPPRPMAAVLPFRRRED